MDDEKPGGGVPTWFFSLAWGVLLIVAGGAWADARKRDEYMLHKIDALEAKVGSLEREVSTLSGRIEGERFVRGVRDRVEEDKR